MIAEIGHALLWLAAACAGLQAVAALVPQARIVGLAVPAAALQGWLWLWIAACLIAVFWSTDLSVAGVAATTDAATPPGLKLAAIVVEDGGWLIVVAALAAWGGGGLAFLRPGGKVALGVTGTGALMFTITLLAGVQPFARLVPAPTEGAGFPVAVRARLAGIGGGVSGQGFALGETRGGTTLVAVTPVAGPDSTGVAAEVRAGNIVLLPEWRETIRPRAAFPVAAYGVEAEGWARATLAPAEPGRWRVGVTRVGWAWLLVPLLIGGAGACAWRRR